MLAGVKATRTFRVRFSGPLDREAEAALEAAEVQPQPATRGGGRNEVLVFARSPDVAIRKVRQALDGRGSFLDFSAEDEDEGDDDGRRGGG